MPPPELVTQTRVESFTCLLEVHQYSAPEFPNIAISSDANPITALKSAINTTNGQGTWHYNSSSSFTVNAGSWSWSNQTGVANGWPNMYHSSGCGSCVHWLPSYADGAGKDWGSGNYYSAWIR